jgi:hypothetical protein
MKTLRISLTALMLVAGLALLGGPTPVQADGPTTFTFAGGSLTTTNLDAWGGMNRLEYHAYFDFSVGPTTITVHGIDLTEIWYEGKWPWPPLAESQGAQARFGITANGFWSRHQIHSAIGNGGGSWDQQGATWNHDDGFRKYLIQNQWSGTTSDVTVGNHQYNVEAYIPRTGAGPSVNDPALVTDRAYNTFDMRITYAPTGIPGEYQVQGWVRLHKAASTDEMAIRPGIPPWGSPYTWVWNVAMNNQADPEDAWVPFFDGSWVITGDYTSARPYVEIMNWGVPQTRSHTFSWDSLVVEGTPAPVSEVCVDDGFAGSSPGDPLDGSACGMGAVTFGYDAFATIQEGIDAVSGSTVYVAAGTYTEAVTIQPGADLTIQGAGRDVTTWIAPADDASRMHCIQCELQGYTGSTTLDISGFTFSVEDNEIDNGGIAILVNKARQGPLNLAIHDNKFVETTTIPGETANSLLLCHNRFAARGTDAPVKIYNNLDETAGGIAMSNSRAFDVYNNTFDGGSDALYIGYGCPTNTTVGDHHIYNNTFKNASNVYPDGPWPSILFSYYGSGTGMTFLPSAIEHNFFEDNDVAVGYGMDSDITYPADVIRDNSFEGSNEYAVQVWGAYSTTVDASGNWWGTDTPTGVAAAVSANVDYTPWLDSGTDTSADPGFQGDFSALHVDDDSPQTGTTGYVQEGINMVSGSTVYVAAGTYNERVTINESVDLRGAQYGVDPTAAGARTTPANESIITEAGLSTPNPDVLIEIPNGVTNVKVDGFTLVGDSNNTTADTSTVRAWDDHITISNNIIDGMYGVLYKGGDTLTVHRNRMVVNKLGVTVQPNPASNVTISENVFNLGSSPVGGESAIYMTSCNQCSATGNTATSFANGNGIGGSNLSHLTVSGNTFTGNKKGVNIWGNSTYILISNNDLSSSVEYGISVKGQDVTITGNEIKDNGDAGVNIDRHVIDTERVAISCNIISGNTNYGVKVNTALVTQMVNAENNWWGDVSGPTHSSNPGGTGDEVSDNVDFAPWSLGTPPCVGSITIVKEADPADGTDFAFDGGCDLGYFVLDDADPDDIDGVADSMTFAGLPPGTYAVAEQVPLDWNLDNIACTTNDPNDTTAVNVAGGSVEIDLDNGETIECTFFNEQKPTAVTLASFTAEAGPGSVVLAWDTGTEVDNAGFNLYRATAEGGSYAKVNGALIAAEGDPVSGASYSFLDKGLSPGTYYYKLEDVDLTGTTALHGPVSAAVLPRLRRPTYRPTLP